MQNQQLTLPEIDRVIEMAWEDRTTFEAIKFQFGLCEKDVINIMRMHMKRGSFNMWRKRVQARSTKHFQLINRNEFRFKCSMQKTISRNKISKRQ